MCAPWDMQHPVEKVRSTGNERVFLTERGASFGYNTLVVDYRSLPVMRAMAPVVFDDAFGAAAFSGQWSERRSAGIHSAAGTGSSGGGRRWAFLRSARLPGPCDVGRRECAETGTAEAAAGDAAGNCEGCRRFEPGACTSDLQAHDLGHPPTTRYATLKVAYH